MSPHTTDHIHVLLVEDHAEIREGLKYIINNAPGFSCVTCATAEEALVTMSPDDVDVVLMDINLPGMSGIECTRRLREQYPSLPIMMCTAYEDDENIFMALSNGAKGYILKRAAGEILIEAIRDLYQGGSPMSSSIARRVVESFQQRKSETDFDLTLREREILDLLAQGNRNKQIADKLFLSPHTIRTHIYHIYEKLQVKNRVEAINRMTKAR
ncbi:MAG: response regulator transcription factor [Flavobacteriales bacterium]|nr:response regulator transcription factor [Flavobacteriales bacterium]